MSRVFENPTLMSSWEPAAFLAPPSKGSTQFSSISGSTTTLPACRCSFSKDPSAQTLNMPFPGDCWPDSRRLVCRDVWFHARGENAPASGTAAGDIQHLRKCYNFNLNVHLLLYRGPNPLHYYRVFMWSTNSRSLQTSMVLKYHLGKEYLFHYIRVCSDSVNSLYLLSIFVWVWQNRPCHIQQRGFGIIVRSNICFCLKPWKYSFQVASLNATYQNIAIGLKWVLITALHI